MDYHLFWSYPCHVVYLKKRAPGWDNILQLKNKNKAKFKLASKIGSIWSIIGSRLGLEPDFLDCVIEERTNDRRLYRVMQKWFANAGQLPNADEYPRTWQGLRNLLDNCEQEEIANEYFEFLSSM